MKRLENGYHPTTANSLIYGSLLRAVAVQVDRYFVGAGVWDKFMVNFRKFSGVGL